MKGLRVIMAFGEEYVVGVGDRLPWHISEELKLFKETTKNQVVIMGKGTFMGLPKFPLPNRINVVLSSGFDGITEVQENGETVIYAESLEAFTNMNRWLDKQWFVIGGPGAWDAAFRSGRVEAVHASSVDYKSTGSPDEVRYQNLDHFSTVAFDMIPCDVADFDEFSHAIYAIEYHDNYEQSIDAVIEAGKDYPKQQTKTLQQ